MDAYHTWLLIRALMLVGILCLSALAGAMLEWRQKHHVPNTHRDSRRMREQRAVV